MIIKAIGTEIVCGAVIGFVASNWSDRVLFLWIVGFIGCVQLVWLRNNPVASFLRNAMPDQEMSIGSIQLTGWKVYAWQFIYSTIVALPFSLMAGLIRVLFFDG